MRGGGFDLLALLAFFPFCHFLRGFFAQNKGDRASICEMTLVLVGFSENNI